MSLKHSLAHTPHTFTLPLTIRYYVFRMHHQCGTRVHTLLESICVNIRLALCVCARARPFRQSLIAHPGRAPMCEWMHPDCSGSPRLHCVCVCVHAHASPVPKDAFPIRRHVALGTIGYDAINIALLISVYVPHIHGVYT